MALAPCVSYWASAAPAKRGMRKKAGAYKAERAERVFVWPVKDEIARLENLERQVIPMAK